MSASTFNLIRLGFSSAVARKHADPHPSDNNIIVIFVIGGISFKEVGQIKSLLDDYNNSNGKYANHGSFQIILGSNMNFVPEDILTRLA